MKVLSLGINLVQSLVLYSTKQLRHEQFCKYTLDFSATFHSFLMFSLKYMNIQIGFFSYLPIGLKDFFLALL